MLKQLSLSLVTAFALTTSAIAQAPTYIEVVSARNKNGDRLFIQADSVKVLVNNQYMKRARFWTLKQLGRPQPNGMIKVKTLYYADCYRETLSMPEQWGYDSSNEIISGVRFDSNGSSRYDSRVSPPITLVNPGTVGYAMLKQVCPN